MMILKKVVATAVATMMTVSPVLAAPVRPSIVQLPAASAMPAPLKMGTRLGGQDVPA